MIGLLHAIILSIKTQLSINIDVTLIHTGQYDQFRYCYDKLLLLVIVNIAYYSHCNDKCHINER